MKRSKTAEMAWEPTYGDTLETTCPKDPEGGKRPDSPECRGFRRKIAEIQTAGQSVGIPVGCLLVVIARQFKFSWETIPWGKFEEIRLFISHHGGDFRALMGSNNSPTDTQIDRMMEAAGITAESTTPEIMARFPF
jgi:hypothetical protein